MLVILVVKGGPKDVFLLFGALSLNWSQRWRMLAISSVIFILKGKTLNLYFSFKF